MVLIHAENEIDNILDSVKRLSNLAINGLYTAFNPP
jgi:hypothetical protein